MYAKKCCVDGVRLSKLDVPMFRLHFSAPLSPGRPILSYAFSGKMQTPTPIATLLWEDKGRVNQAYWAYVYSFGYDYIL